MDTEIICLSDDDEREEEDKSVSQTTAKMRNMHFNYNVYENPDWTTTKPPRSKATVTSSTTTASSSMQPTTSSALTSCIPATVEKKPKEPEVDIVYVPDDNEEEILLIGPIRRLSKLMLFSNTPRGPPEDPPYENLLELEKHLANSLRNVSFTTETNVWAYTIYQLSTLRFYYNHWSNVS